MASASRGSYRVTMRWGCPIYKSLQLKKLAVTECVTCIQVVLAKKKDVLLGMNLTCTVRTGMVLNFSMGLLHNKVHTIKSYFLQRVVMAALWYSAEISQLESSGFAPQK